jgi:RES domain-containing protein
MITAYRIVSHIWGEELLSSGFPARWNSAQVYVIYCAESRSLATLENIAHRKRNGLNARFTLQVIEIPDDIKVERINKKVLPPKWSPANEEAYEKCREIGDLWVSKQKSAVLAVPSAIVNDEINYLLNPNHPDFSKIKLIKKEVYRFDPRLGIEDEKRSAH